MFHPTFLKHYTPNDKSPMETFMLPSPMLNIQDKKYPLLIRYLKEFTDLQAPIVVPVVVDEVIKEQDQEFMDEQDHILIK